MGDSGTFTVLTRYESMRLPSLRRSEKPQRGAQYDIRDELIRPIGKIIRNINKDGRADGVLRLQTFSKS